MSTYINKELIYYSELGEFYLAKNPEYAINAKQPTILINIEANNATFFSSKRDCARSLSNILNRKIQLDTFAKNDWIDSGEIIQNKIILLSKNYFDSLIPDQNEFNEGTIDLSKYNLNFSKLSSYYNKKS